MIKDVTQFRLEQDDMKQIFIPQIQRIVLVHQVNQTIS